MQHLQGAQVQVPAGLSASSVGSSGMQHVSLDSLELFGAAFSILGRIERDATMELLLRGVRYSISFSILGRIERDATRNRQDSTRVPD